MSLRDLTSAFALRLFFYRLLYFLCNLYTREKIIRILWRLLSENIVLILLMGKQSATWLPLQPQQLKLINNVQLTVYVIVSCNDIIERKFAWWVFITTSRSHCYRLLPLSCSQAVVWCYSLNICKVGLLHKCRHGFITNL